METIRKVLGFIIALVVGAYKIITGLLSLAIVGGFAYLFFFNEWRDHEEEEYEEDREELVAVAADTARERGLGDLDELRQDYDEACPLTEAGVREGDLAEICGAMVDALMDRSREVGMTMFDHNELAWDLCVLDARQWDDDPESNCDRESIAIGTLAEAVAQGMCELDSAWVMHPRYAENLTKRGPAVYSGYELYVDCSTGLMDEYDYYGFFEGLVDDKDYASIIDRIYEVLEEEKPAAALALLDEHEFGEDEQTDQWILNQFIEDRYSAVFPEVLKRIGGKVNFDTDYYDQPLSHAIEEQSTTLALMLLEAGADPIRSNEYGLTPIAHAAEYGMLEVVRELMARGADVDGVAGSESSEFASPLLMAAMNSHEATALWLLEKGARIAPENPARYPDWDADWFLEATVTGGDLPVVMAVIQKGAKTEDSRRLFEGAVTGANPDVVLFLLEQGYELPGPGDHDRLYDVLTNVIEEEGEGRIEDGVRIFEILLGQGLDMSEVSDTGWHYGHGAVRSYAPSILIPHLDESRYPAVNAKRQEFVIQVIDAVLATGIDVDQPYDGETMLMRAAKNGNAGILRHLLEHGADASLRNDEGETALEMAVDLGRKRIDFRSDNADIKANYTETLELLGGSSEMLQPEPESAD